MLLGFGWLLQKLAARFRRTKPPPLALALASIAGPGSIARQVAISLGLGLGFLVAIALIDRSLMAEFEENIQIDAPGYYFLDVDAQNLAAFRDTAKAVERFQREARAAGRLKHTNIVTVHQLGEDKGVWFCAMELVEEACDERDPVLLFLARAFPGFERVRDDPRFADIARRLQLP